MKHYAFQDVIQYNEAIKNKLSDICEPIFSGFGFKSLGYTRIKKNGERLILDTHSDLLNYYCDSAFQEKVKGDNSLVCTLDSLGGNSPHQEGYIQMFSGDPKSKLEEKLYHYDVWNCISITFNMKHYSEVYHLSNSKGSNASIIDLCVNKKVLLYRFAHYFRDKLRLLEVDKAPILRNVETPRIFIKNPAEGEGEGANDMNYNIKLHDFVKRTQVEKFYLKTHGIFIGRREAECLYYLSLGKTSKEIANHLKISARTIESYINSLKLKTDVHSKSALIMLAHENFLAITGCV